MSAIFISHSSSDDQVAAKVRAWLEEQGHRSVFLDFDPAAGIPAGRNWEQELYQQLRACRAVVVLCSESSMASRWCFAEITHAKSLGKHVFPVKIDPCEVDPVLLDRQVVDLTQDGGNGLQQLGRGLAAAGIDAADPFDWDGTRPPFPGLMAFQEKDAAVFFGREREIIHGLDVLGRMQRFGGSGLAVVLGASGSGKSSLLRAGLLPRLRRDPDHWQVAGPFRPGEVPLWQLAAALKSTFPASDQTDLLTRLVRLVRNAESSGAEPARLIRELLAASPHPEATVLLAIDQLEEMLDRPPDHECSRVLALLRSGLSRPYSPFVVLATLRSDYLPDLQQSPAMQDLELETISLGTMSSESVQDVILKPAELAGITVEPALVQAILSDLETDDALPLLAFTLRELYEGYASAGVLPLADYRDQLGGLQGSIARAAGAALDAALAASKRSAERDEKELRAAFLAMARINAGGQYVRKPVAWDELTESSQFLLEHFIDARLLVMSGDGSGQQVEVAHEAMFRAWDKLRGWLDEDRGVLHLHREVSEAAAQWETSSHDEDYLLRMGRLQRAMELRDEGLLHLDEQELRFLKASETAALKYARFRTRRRRLVTAAALVTALVMTVLMLRERDVSRKAISRQLVIASDSLREKDPMLASMLARRAVETRPGPEAFQALLDSLARTRRTTVLEGHSDFVTRGAWSPDGRRVLTVSQDRTGILWSSEGERLAVLAGHQGWVENGSWSPDGLRVLTVSNDKTARIWDVEGNPLASLEGHEEGLLDGAWSPDGLRILTVSFDTTGRIWDVEGRLLSTLAGHSGAVNRGAWSSDGQHVLTVSDDATARIWDAAGAPIATLEGHEDGIPDGAWSPDGRRVLTVSYDATARVWDRQGRPLATLNGHTQPVKLGAWSPDGEHILTVSEDATARVWNRAGELEAILEGHREAVNFGAWSPGGERILTVSLDKTARIWAPDGTPIKVLEGHTDSVHLGAWSPDGELVLTLAGADPPRIWELYGNPLNLLRKHEGWINHGAWSPDGRHVLTVSQDQTACIWDLERTDCLRLRHTGSVQHGAWSPPDGARVLTVSVDDRAHIWDAGGRLIAELAGHEASLNDGEWSPDGRRVLTASDDSTARVWDRDGRPLVTIAGHEGSVRRAAWSPDGGRVLTASADATARVWDAEGGAPIAVLKVHEGPLNHAAWSPDGSRILTASDDRTARIWAPDGEVVAVLKGHVQAVLHGAWSRPFGEHVLTVSEDATARIWHPDGRLAAVLKGHTGPIPYGAWSPEGKRVLTVSNDQTTRIWDLDGRVVAVLDGHTGWVSHGAWSRPYGERILTVSRDGTARIWPPESLLKLADRLITRDFTPEERARYLELR